MALFCRESGSTDCAEGKGWFSGSCLEPVPHLPTQGIWQLSAPENHLWTQESIFLLLRGALGRGGRKVAAE